MAGKETELRSVLARYRTAIITVALVSAVLNVIMLGGSFYMMLIYDSVLPSHSLATLAGLFVMVAVVYAFQGLFDVGRARILASIGEGFERQLGRRVQEASGKMALNSGRVTGDGLMAMRDLDNIRSFLSGSGPGALLDLPWIVFFLGVLTVLHYWLGLAALVGAALLIGLTIFANRLSAEPTRQLGKLTALRSGEAEASIRHAETIAALGMSEQMRDRWEEANGAYLAANDRLSKTVISLGTISKVFRMFLQSLILTVGAFLVIKGEASGGVIFASSLLFGRALAPVDMAIANWRSFAAARAGWNRLTELFEQIPPTAEPDVQLPLPHQNLIVEALTLVPPGGTMPTLHNVTFRAAAGDAIGLIGPSGAGKTSLGRALVGIWQPHTGAVRLDGAALDQWERGRLGRAIGYLPQSVELFEGTIAQNIARFTPYADSAAIIAAAREAGVHNLIVQLPQGYDTPVGRDGAQLSAGQRQRIGLARALFGRPFLVLLDEPNSNLDQDGDMALERAITAVRARGGIAIIIAHRPSLLAKTSHIMVLRDGRVQAFGLRDEILTKVLRPAPVSEQSLPAPAHTNMEAVV